jgi:hypothetical protein
MITVYLNELRARLDRLEQSGCIDRLDLLERDLKNTKWAVEQAMKIAEQNEQAIDTISRILQQDPKAMRRPVNKGGRPKLAIKRVK